MKLNKSLILSCVIVAYVGTGFLVSLQAKAEETVDCVEVYKGAHKLMMARHNQSVIETLEMYPGAPDIVNDVYREPQMQSEEGKLRSAKRFAEKEYLACEKL
jgi:hypothetical protein